MKTYIRNNGTEYNVSLSTDMQEISIQTVSPANPEKAALKVTRVQFEQFKVWINSDDFIQDAIPSLNADEREFLISGVPVGDFDKMFEEEE